MVHYGRGIRSGFFFTVMKKHHLLIILFFAASSLFGQSLIRFESFVIDSTESMETSVESINDLIGEGYVPVGLDVLDDGTMAIPFVYGLSFGFNSWQLVQLDLGDTFVQEFSDYYRDGFVPFGFDILAETAYVFLVRSDIRSNGWRLPSVSLASSAEELQEFIAAGYGPYGIAAMDTGEYLVLMNRTNVPLGASTITSFDSEASEEIAETMEVMFANGYMPWGVTSANGDLTFIFREVQ